MISENQLTILLITPPLTQLNTPYPATSVIKGFLVEKEYSVHQADLGLELILDLFRPIRLQKIFDQIRHHPNANRFARLLALESDYLKTVNPVIRFLQDRDLTLSHLICREGFLPQGPRFEMAEDLDWAFGTLGSQDRARFLATQFINDLADIVRTFISSDFGFVRYAERLALSATNFSNLEVELQKQNNLLDEILFERLSILLNTIQPDLVGLTVPFPGSLFGALKCGHYIKTNAPATTVVMGGGYINTELRNFRNPAVFQYTDFITLDDGEAPILQIARLLEGRCERKELVRTFCLDQDRVVYIDTKVEPSHAGRATPDYSDLKLDQYLSVLDMANPMHRLWSDGRWNKLMLAHGCYWGKCAFCDVSLDYINRVETERAGRLVDRIEAIIEQTGQSGFHFIDEAAPPYLLKELAIEILRRDLTISWWTNVRFENRFNAGLCELLAASGCIAVAGGLETVSDRLLKKMNKGVTLVQAARVADHFQDAGVMVHAYLMYGFPTQTSQETIDALEYVRQFFKNGLLQSGFWHRFALTAHSPVGLNPDHYGIVITGPDPGDFARNELQYSEVSGASHEQFDCGLQKALYNYMHGIGLEAPLSDWFDFDIPDPAIPPNQVRQYLRKRRKKAHKSQQLLWTGPMPIIEKTVRHKKGKTAATCQLLFQRCSHRRSIRTSARTAEWLIHQLEKTTPANHLRMTLDDLKTSYCAEVDKDFEAFRRGSLWKALKSEGLLLI